MLRLTTNKRDLAGPCIAMQAERIPCLMEAMGRVNMPFVRAVRDKRMFERSFNLYSLLSTNTSEAGPVYIREESQGSDELSGIKLLRDAMLQHGVPLNLTDTHLEALGSLRFQNDATQKAQMG